MKIEVGADRNDGCRIDGAAALVIMALDVLEVDGLGDAGFLVNVSGVRGERQIIDYTRPVALEVVDIDRVRSHQRREEPNIGFGQKIASKRGR